MCIRAYNNDKTLNCKSSVSAKGLEGLVVQISASYPTTPFLLFCWEIFSNDDEKSQLKVMIT